MNSVAAALASRSPIAASTAGRVAADGRAFDPRRRCRGGGRRACRAGRGEELRARGSSVTVLGRDRVGGRVLSHDIGSGKVVEVGAQWIGPPRTGSPPWPPTSEWRRSHPGQGFNVLEYAGRLRRYRGAIPHQSRRAPRRRAGTAKAQPAGSRSAAARALGGTPRRTPGRPDRGHVDAPQPRHQGGAGVARAGHRVGLGGARGTSRCCTCSSTSTRRAASSFSSTPRAGPSRTASWAVLSGSRCAWPSGSATSVFRLGAGAADRARRRWRDGPTPMTVARARRAIVAIAPALAARIAYDPPLPGYRDQLTQRSRWARWPSAWPSTTNPSGAVKGSRARD